MKKTRINLLTSKDDFYKLEEYFGIFRKIVLFLTVSAVVIIGVIAFVDINKNIRLNDLGKQKEDLLTQLAAKKGDEVKLVLLSKKLSAYNQFIEDDAHFLPYYNLLLDTLKNSSQSASLSNFKIDKLRNVDFTLMFGNFGEMLQSFQLIESDQFLSNFNSLNITSFTATQKSNTNSTTSAPTDVKYELSFDGQFKQLNEKNN